MLANAVAHPIVGLMPVATNRSSRTSSGTGALLALVLAGALLTMWPTATLAATCPAVGAIRWDAWYGSKGVPGMAVEKTLGPARWHDRLPSCAQVVAPDSVQISCDSADQMTAEIDDAARAGISFWAFVAYPEDDPMSLGLKSYLKSSNRGRVRFALVSEMDKWGNGGAFRPVIERYVRLMREPGYQMTPAGRPVFFLGFVAEDDMTRRFGGRKGLRTAIDEFRRVAQANGLANPYIVLLERNVARAASLVADLGLEGVSAYAVADNNVRNGEFRQLAQLVSQYWSDAAKADLALVPPVMTGWDRRPRVLNPVAWEKGRYSDEQMERFFKRPTMPELTSHVAAALDFAARYAGSAAANAVLVYAWNEFDEGGWLAPTRGEGSGRLDAVKEAIRTACPRPDAN